MQVSVDETPHLRGRCRVFLNGMEVTEDCRAAKDGPDGWVELIPRPVRVRSDEVVTELRRGVVQIEVLA